MLRIVLGVITGFFAWVIVWFGSEKVFSVLWPEWFGAQQLAFEAALTEGGQFNPDTKFLLTHCVCGSIASLIAGKLPRLSIYLYVPDSDAVQAAAIAAGAKEIRPVATQFYGNREGGVEDPFGITWWISTRVEDVSPEEMMARMAEMKPPA